MRSSPTRRTPSRSHQPSSLSALASTIADEYRFYGREWSLPAFRAMATYRFGVWAREADRSTVLSKVRGRMLDRTYLAMARFVRNQYGIEIPRTADIGHRVRFAHQGGIVIHRFARIGDRCLIHQNVTLGNAGRGHGEDTAPVIGNDVEIGVGASILGSVMVGDGARIGANVVVYTDVPAEATVVVNSPRVLFAPNTRERTAQRKDEP